jgi:CIC family chloride channel protein
MGGAKGIPIRAFAIFLLAAAIGVAGGVLGSGFQIGLDQIQQLLTGRQLLPSGQYEDLSAAVNALPWWRVVAVPTLGGLCAGLLLLLLRRGRKPPFGVTDIVGMVQLRRGTIRLRDSLVQIASSACSIGSGGSIGREGGTLHLAATVAAKLNELLPLRSRARAMLLGCGVSAGMSAAYNAPIAGAMFVMEIVLGNFAMDVFAPIVVSSVLATMVRWVLLGENAIYGEVLPPDLKVLSWNLVLAAIVLGLMCGVGGILFRKALAWGRRAMQLPRVPLPVRLMLGGLVVGVIGLWLPQTWGNGFEVIKEIAHDAPPMGLIAALLFWKVVATSATVGSGALGGIFTPNLVIGAAFGGFFAHGLQWFVHGPMDHNEFAAFAFVGMAGLTAATMHAPVTAVVLVFELTGHYQLVLPVMLCSIVASIVASMIDEDSYYTATLKARGQAVPTGIEELAIKTTYVRDVMRKDLLTVADTAGFDEVMDVLANHRGDTIYVLDKQGALSGRIQLQDVKNFINDPSLGSVVIAADLTRPAVTVTPEDSLANVLKHFDDPELDELAVVAPQSQRLIGRVRQQDVIAGFRSEVLGQQRRARFQAAGDRRTSLVELPAEWEVATLTVPDAWHQLTIDNLPADVQAWLVPMVVTVTDGNGTATRVPATQELVLHEGQQMLALCRNEDLRRWQQEQR